MRTEIINCMINIRKLILFIASRTSLTNLFNLTSIELIYFSQLLIWNRISLWIKILSRLPSKNGMYFEFYDILQLLVLKYHQKHVHLLDNQPMQPKDGKFLHQVDL